MITILERTGRRFSVTKYSYSKKLMSHVGLFSVEFNNGLKVTEYLEKDGFDISTISAAYTALMRRGYTKAYFTKSNLTYLL